MDEKLLAKAERASIVVEMENIGEGWWGDYDPNNPDDENLARFTVYMDGEQVEDASYCTSIPVGDTERLEKAAQIIPKEVYEPLKDGSSVKKLCESLSWIGNIV